MNCMWETLALLWIDKLDYDLLIKKMLILGHDVSRIMDAYFRRKVQDLCRGIVSTI